MPAPKYTRRDIGMPRMQKDESEERKADWSDRIARALEDITTAHKAIAGARIVRALTDEDRPQQTDETDSLDKVGQYTEILRKVTEIQDKQVERAQAENQALRSEVHTAFERGVEHERRTSDVAIAAITQQSQLAMSFLKEKAELEARLAAVEANFTKTVADVLLSAKDKEIEVLRKEIEEMKRMLPQGQHQQSQSMPLPQQGQMKSELETLVDSLRRVKMLKQEVDELSGGTRTVAHDVNDPQVRYMHKTIDWEDEARKREAERQDKLTQAQIETERAKARALEQLAPPVVDRLLSRLLGGNHGTRNGLPDTPPPESVPKSQFPGRNGFSESGGEPA